MTEDQILEAKRLLERGVTRGEVARKLGLTYQTVRYNTDPKYAEKSRRQSREAKVRRNTRLCAGGCGKRVHYQSQSGMCAPCVSAASKVWTREAIITAIRKWADEHGKPPSAPEWTRSGDDHPATSTVSMPNGEFDSWGSAIEAAGFPRPPVTYHGKPRELYWSRERTIQAIQDWVAKYGERPTGDGWKGRAEGRPTREWVVQLFGSWNAGIEAAGFKGRTSRYG